MVARYIWRVILPYFCLVWLLLTVVLFFQQGSRLSEILFGNNIPVRLLAELSAALIVSVLAFTGPMAVLAGIVIGLGQMRGDSELTAFQAAGWGSRVILWPCLLLGLIVSSIALFINLEGVPWAARMARRTAVEAALLKLESPIEPGVFNTEFSNYVIYVKDGNNELGVWERIFIYLPEKNGQVRLITARSGRIDAAADQSELVLSEAVVTTLPSQEAAQKTVTLESLDLLRVSLETGRGQLRQKLIGVERAPDEMGLFELAGLSQKKIGKEKLEAEILWHRRLSLSLAPIFLSILGVALIWRFGRGGRGWSSVLSVAVLISYYLITLLGEQSARANLIPTALGGWLATIAVVGLSLNWLWPGRRTSQRRLIWSFSRAPSLRLQNSSANSKTIIGIQNNILNNSKFHLAGLLELDFLRSLGQHFFLIVIALLTLFHVFTVFEVLRGLTNNAQGPALVAKYLFLLSPLVIWQIAPTALMLAVLITYAVKARRNELIVWGAAGQSVYTLILPGILSAILLGLINWQWQERVLPLTNPRQDVLRSQLRGGAGSVGSQEGRFWVASNEGIYSFTAAKGSDNVEARDVNFYLFSKDQTRLEKVIQASDVRWQDAAVRFNSEITEIIWRTNFVETRKPFEPEFVLASVENPFSQINLKTANLSRTKLAAAIKTSDSQIETRRFQVALQQRYATLVLPLVIIFFSLPLALMRSSNGQGNRSLGLSMVIAIGVWLLFTLTNGVFENLGNEGVLPPSIAVWSPLIIFSSLGWYLLARLRN